jgi:hypothetical protein
MITFSRPKRFGQVDSQWKENGNICEKIERFECRLPHFTWNIFPWSEYIAEITSAWCSTLTLSYALIVIVFNYKDSLLIAAAGTAVTSIVWGLLVLTVVVLRSVGVSVPYLEDIHV